MVRIDEHPALLLPEYRRIRRRLLWMALTGALWSLGVFMLSVLPPPVLRPYSHPLFQPGILYSWYSCMHSFYVALSVLLAHFLGSRGWLRAAAFAAALPGPGALFSLPQIVPALRVYRRLADPRWQTFFESKLLGVQVGARPQR